MLRVAIDMGRHRSPLKQALDIKSRLFFLSRILTLGNRSLRRLTSFYPDYKIPDDTRIELLHRSSYHYPWADTRHEKARLFVFENNVDALTVSSWDDPQATERYVAIIRNIIVPGLLCTPVDPTTATQINSEKEGASNWSRARPSISGMTHRHLSDDLTIVIPKLNHFGHLLTDFLMPLFFALQTIGFSEGRRLNVVTSNQPNALILAFIEAVKHAGYEVIHIETKMWQEIRVPRLLYATTHTRNLELKFATPEALDFARDHLLKALPQTSNQPSKRIFLLRGDTKTRQVEGEAELARKLETIGFSTLVGTWGNLAEQITAFRDAEVIVGAHGAGLANVLWSKPGALLIELFANDARKTTGLHWAASAGVKYAAIAGSNEGEMQSFEINSDTIFAKIQTTILKTKQGCELK